METSTTPLAGLLLIKPKVIQDERGYFFESYTARNYHPLGLPEFVQDNVSHSVYGVIRGLHYQLAPHAQSKLVQVLQGKVLDVVVDLRVESPTFGQHFSIELSSENGIQFFIPQGFAHGFSVLSQTAVFSYKCDQYYFKEAERGLVYNDPALAIDWQIPANKQLVSPKDLALPAFNKAEINFIR